MHTDTTFATLRARFAMECAMYRNFSFAAALLAAAFSG
ncbi:deoxyribonuclease I, partial [Salmonella enterica subsp. enterica serovar Typhi]|nr:deoxyribonuclease I [Salmonella enterica subsp. enterica serovar Typhi]